MMTFKKLARAAFGEGKKLRGYFTQGADIEAGPDDAARRMTAYYTGREARADWRLNMPASVVRALGIDVSKPPTDEALDRLFECRRADNGKEWSSHNRTLCGYDFQCAPHKSVTLAAEFAATEAERAAYNHAIDRANDIAMRFLASQIGWARRGDGGREGADPGEVGFVTFTHESARPTFAIQDGRDGQTFLANEMPIPGDPHRHRHNFLFNVVVTESGHVGSLDSAEVHGRVHEFGAWFQMALAMELRKLGVNTAYSKDGKAVVVSAVPEEANELFSKSGKSVLLRAKQEAAERGLDWNDMRVDRKLLMLGKAAVWGRLTKGDDKSDRAFWRAQAEEIGFGPIETLNKREYAELSREERMERAVRHTSMLLEQEFHTAAVVDLNVIRTHAARGLIGVGAEGPEDIDRVIGELEKRGLQIHGRQASLQFGLQDDKIRVTNTVQVEIEREMKELARAAALDRSGALEPGAVRKAILSSGLDFSRELQHGEAQVAAIYAMGQGGNLVFLEGVAGAGKTTLLKPLVRAWRDDGRKVLGIALGWKAADALKDAGIRDTYAAGPFLDGLHSGSIEVTRNTVIVVEENSQIGPRQFLELLHLQQRTGCTIRGLGDGEQCQAIEASSAVEILRRSLPAEARPTLLTTVRQDTARGREIAGLFRSGQAAKALLMKREDGTARFLGGDYDQVCDRIAEFYLGRRDAVRASGSNKSVTVSALTNQDAGAISGAIHRRLRDRGEITGPETMYAAIDHRQEKYDLPLVVGGKYRLFKKTYAKIDGRSGFIGSNGDVVEVVGFVKDGLLMSNRHGEVGHVQWRRLKDPSTGRLLLGFGHCLTVDSAQGITSGEHINALPRGTAGITKFKAYTAESRHVSACWTLISEAAEMEAERESRAFGDERPIVEADLWLRAAKNMSEKPYKALGIDLVDGAEVGHAASVDSFIHLSERMQRQRASGRTHAKEFADYRQERALRAALQDQIKALDRAVRTTSEAVEAFRAQVARGLEDLKVRLVTEWGALAPRIIASQPSVPRPSPSQTPSPSP